MNAISHTLHETEDAALPDISRRHALLVATSVMGGIGLLATAVPFVASFQPSEQAKALGGPISIDFSGLLPGEMKTLVKECHAAWESVGRVQYGPQTVEKGFIRGRRSLYIAEDMKAGDVLDANNLRSVRPGFGLPPKYYELLLGKKIVRDVQRGTAVSWDLIFPPAN